MCIYVYIPYMKVTGFLTYEVRNFNANNFFTDKDHHYFLQIRVSFMQNRVN